jgi:hypothetical protein
MNHFILLLVIINLLMCLIYKWNFIEFGTLQFQISTGILEHIHWDLRTYPLQLKDNNCNSEILEVGLL